MKIGFISDIHGNFEALKSVLAELDALNVGAIYCLGDVVGYYAQPNECCEALRERGVLCLMGNHDWYVAGGGFCQRSRSVNDCIQYQRRVLTAENVGWIREFPVSRRAGDMRLVHGGWSDPIDEYLKPSPAYFARIDGDVFLSGHTHIQSLDAFGSKVYCNPGSVGQPRDGDPRAAFAVYDGEFRLLRVQYDMESVFSSMKAAGFDDYYYGCLVTGAGSLCRPPGMSSRK